MRTLDAAREAYDARRWKAAVAWFLEADEGGDLSGDDLVLLAVAAHQCGEDEVSATSWQRAHRERLDGGDRPGAIRCAFWLGMTRMSRGDPVQGGAWMGRATEIADHLAEECPEQGLVRLAPALGALHGGDPDGALALFSAIADLGERFDDADVVTLGRLGVGQARVRRGEVDEGMLNLDQAMVAVVAQDVSPVAAGIVYCAVIETCQEVADVSRARSWTNALTEWCEGQPDLVPFRGRCLVHRAEILQLDGRWEEAAREAQRACALLSDPPGQPPLGAAFYQLGEIRRMTGDVDAALESYRRAREFGREPQPGLALLRLATGKAEIADAALERVLGEQLFPEDRTRQLAARVRTALAAGRPDAAAAAADELSRLATAAQIPYATATAAAAQGLVVLHQGDPMAALARLRTAVATFGELGATYEVAQVRESMATAFRLLGDVDSAELELDAARDTYERLGAALDVERVDSLEAPESDTPGDGLTGRELEVLRQVAGGLTNRQVAELLAISDKTVARHISNIFTKIGVSNRAAATAYAYEHHLV